MAEDQRTGAVLSFLHASQRFLLCTHPARRVTESRTYDAANQVSGWTYDAAGNLLDDGTSTYGYDSFSRVITATKGTQQLSYAYNGDGTLVQQTANGVMTRFTQDLVAPLT